MEESEQCCLELYTLNNSIDEYINIMSYLNTHTHIHRQRRVPRTATD